VATPAQLITRKKAMLSWGEAAGLPVPAGFNASLGTFGGPAERFLMEIQRTLGVPATGIWGPSVQSALFARSSGAIGTRYEHAVRRSGTRPLSAVKLYVLHDMENANELKAAEQTGSFFESRSATGSAHFGTDDDSIEQYLPLEVIPWGAPHANADGIHIEQMGLAAWTGEQWLTRGAGTLLNTAWLLAHLYRHATPHVPLRALSDAQLRAGDGGVTTHRQITRVLGGGTHTDPGPGYPLGYVIRRAHVFAGI
jgi:hypothetical protein